ncbi:hypothetical protein V8B97DRAFT_2058464 [Scleroderma yunnanense]
MNVAGPSRPHVGRAATNGRVNTSVHEDDLLRLLGDLGPMGAQHLQQYYENRSRTGETMTDHDLAMSFFLQNAADMAAMDEDRALASLLAEELNLEDNIAMLHDWADAPQAPPLVQPQNTRAMAANRTTGNIPSLFSNPLYSNDTQLAQTWGGWFASMFSGWFTAPQTNSAAPRTEPCTRTERPTARPPTPRPTGHVCVICQDPIYGSEVRAPCSHYYDITCLTDLFESATRDESLYPPRCCRQNIPFAQVQTHLSHELVARFEEKGREFGTINRVYCVQPTCSRFLGPISQGTLFSGGPPIYDCPAPGCTTRTCAGCRGRYDGWTHTCRQDQGAEQVLNLGQNQGWARCPGCAQLIELNMGCFHMTCRCRTEFCYLCRARWKTCACPQWDERRLLAAAEQRVDAQLGHVRREPVPPEPEIWPVRPAQQRIVPIIRPRVQPVPPVPARPAALPRTPTPPPIVQQRRPAPVQNRVQPTPGPAQPALVPAWRRHEEWRRRVAQAHLSVSASTSTPAPAAPASTPAVRAQPQATTPATNHPVWRQSASANPAVGSPQQPTATPTGGSLARPSPPIVPPKPAELTRSVRGSTIQAEAGPSTTSKVQTQAQASLRTPTAMTTTSTPLTNLNERLCQKQQSGTQAHSERRTGTQNDAVRQGMIREMIERLRVDHECDHAKWKYRRGGGRCENCHVNLPLYLFVSIPFGIFVC